MSLRVLILAGGAGSRLGNVRKANLRIGNRSLLQRVIDRLGPVSSPLLISTGPSHCPQDVPGIAVSDPAWPFGGPLAGILAGAIHLRGSATASDRLVSIAVDTPFLPLDYVQRLEEGAGSGAAYAGWNANAYPTNALWPMSVLFDLIDAAAAGTAPDSPRRVLADCGANIVDWSGLSPEDPFANLNTLADLIALSRRAKAEGE